MVCGNLNMEVTSPQLVETHCGMHAVFPGLVLYLPVEGTVGHDVLSHIVTFDDRLEMPSPLFVFSQELKYFYLYNSLLF